MSQVRPAPSRLIVGRMSTKRAFYSVQVKQEAVDRLRTGVSARTLAGEMGIHVSTIDGWGKKYLNGESPTQEAERLELEARQKAEPQQVVQKITTKEFSETSSLALDQKISEVEDLMIDGIRQLIDDIPNKVKNATLTELFTGIDNMSNKVVALVKARTIRELAQKGADAEALAGGGQDANVNPPTDKEQQLIDVVRQGNQISLSVLEAAQRQASVGERLREAAQNQDSGHTSYAHVPVRERETPRN